MLRPLPLRRYLKAMASLGFNERALLIDTDIDLAAADDARYFIELEQYRQVFENMARADDRHGLGLDIGLSTGITDFGPLGHAAICCKTTRHSMEEFWPRYGEMFGLLGCPIFSSDNAGHSTLEITTPTLTESASRFCVEEALGQLLSVGTVVAGRKPIFENLELAYAPPAYHERYRELFRCPVFFGAKRTRATIDRRWLEKPLPTRNKQLSDFYQQHLKRFHEHVEDNAPLVSRVRNLLLHRSNGALPSMTEAASELGLSERTLCRSLQSAGLSYRKLVEEFRVKLAVTLIASSQASAKGICYQLGFHDVNAFRRAFKSWTGKSVNQYRGID